MLKKNEGNIQTFITNRSGSGCCKYITESRLLVDFLWEKMNTKRIGAFLIRAEGISHILKSSATKDFIG